MVAAPPPEPPMNPFLAISLMSLVATGAQAAQYQLMVYETPAELAKRSDPSPAGKAYWERFAAYGEQLKAAGILRGGAALHGGRTARSVTVEGGQVRVADRPVASSKTELGGYFVIETDRLEDAVAWAAKAPSSSAGGAVEVRPFYPVPGMMAPGR